MNSTELKRKCENLLFYESHDFFRIIRAKPSVLYSN